MSQTKITVKIYEPLMRNFDAQVESLFIKRDAFLNSMIKGELRHLESDLQGKRLSPKAKRYIAGELKRLGTVTVNVSVEKSTADELNAVVESTNIVRDSFINRLIMFLRSSDFLLKYLELPLAVMPSEFKAGLDPMPTSPMKAIEAVHADPLFYLRAAAEERLEAGIYLIDLPPKLTGFACYMDESRVPGTEAYEKAALDSQAMLNELIAFETDAFQGQATVRSQT